MTNVGATLSEKRQQVGCAPRREAKHDQVGDLPFCRISRDSSQDREARIHHSIDGLDVPALHVGDDRRPRRCEMHEMSLDVSFAPERRSTNGCVLRTRVESEASRCRNSEAPAAPSARARSRQPGLPPPPRGGPRTVSAWSAGFARDPSRPASPSHGRSLTVGTSPSWQMAASATPHTMSAASDLRS